MRHENWTIRVSGHYGAVEMGNSPQVIIQNYRRPVSKADGKRWFKIMPS